MTQVIPVTQARKNLLTLVDTIDESYTRVDITKNGRIKATMVSPDYLDSLEETIYTLEHSMGDIRKAQKEIAKGEYVTLDALIKDVYAREKLSHSKKGKKTNR